MRAVLAALLALALSACITTDERGFEQKKAEPDLREAARLNTQLGMDYLRKGEVDLAAEKLQRALGQDSGQPLTHSTLALVYVRRGERALAEQHYRRALALDAANPSVRNNFGVFLCGDGKTAEAEQHFLEAARDARFKTPEAAWTNAGVCARRIPDVDRAERYFVQALQLNPNYAEALAQMAVLTLQRREYLRARGFLQRYEQVGPPSAETLWIGYQTEVALGDRDAAEDYRRRLHEQFPQSVESARASGAPVS